MQLRDERGRGQEETRDELALRAAHYAACLNDGDEILEDVDGPYVDPFRLWLPDALARRGMRLEAIPGGWVVRGGGHA